MRFEKSKRYISSIVAIALVAGSLCAGLLAYGANDVRINAANFPDENWRTIVSAEYDENGDDALSLEERQDVYTMIIPGMLDDYCDEDSTITDLTGIEHFASLKRLYCGGIGLSSLDVSGLPNLEQLTCQGNNMRTLTLGSQSKLYWLNCASNDLSTIDISRCPALTRLDCYSNSLTALNAIYCPALEELYCQQNQLRTLKVGGLTRLNTLYCANNHLWELDLSSNSSLTGVTAYMLDNQTVEAEAEIEGSSIVIQHDFTRNDYVVSSSFDTSDGVDGFKDGYFVTHNAEKMMEGLDYKYTTGNRNSDDLSVHATIQRAFHVVRYFLSQEDDTPFDSHAVASGDTDVPPVVTQAPTCMTFSSWSQPVANVTSDLDVYAQWEYSHNFQLVAFNHGDATIRCADCGTEQSLDFLQALNTKTGDANFAPVLDVVKDGYINAKDYAKLTKDYRR